MARGHARRIYSPSVGRPLLFPRSRGASRRGYIVETVEAATGVNLWREWARVEVADDEHTYEPPQTRREYSGIAVSLARQEEPDTSSYTDPEIVYRIKKHHHVGLIIRSPELERILELLGQYEQRFKRDFTAVAPQQERPE
jgi:hypothetical protein